MRTLIVISLLVLVSCSKNSAVSKKLSGTDSLIINFYEHNTDSVARSVATTDKKAINRLAEFIAAKETEHFKCGFDGNLQFFEKGKIVSDVSFKYSYEPCRHFLLEVEGKLMATKMNNEAADLLESLAEGKATY